MKYLTLLFISFSVNAGIYFDVGAELHDETTDSFYQRDGTPIKNIIGSAELGYEYKNMSIYLKHLSSMQQEDTGLNTIGIKFRVIGK